MAIVPLDSNGVEEKLIQLYSMSDQDLDRQASAVEKDFCSWLSHNFNLHQSQNDYLEGIASEAINYFGQQCALCFRNRLYISFIYSPRSNSKSTKFVEVINNLNLRADNFGRVVTSGSFGFVINYKTN